MKKSKIKMSIVLLVFVLCIIAATLFWSNRNLVVTLKREPAQITAMDIVVIYSGKVGEEPGPVTYSDTLDGEDFARLTAHTSFETEGRFFCPALRVKRRQKNRPHVFRKSNFLTREN